MANKPFTAKYGKTKEEGYIPSDWNDISFKTYIKYLKELKSQSIEGIYSALTGVSKEMWSNPHSAELYATIDYHLRFTGLEPVTEMPTHININEEFYQIEKDFLNLPLGMYQDMILMIQQITGDEVDEIEQIALMPKLIALFVLKEYKDIEEVERTAEKINLMPCDVVYTIGGFFLQKLTVLKSGTEKKQQVKGSLTNKVKQVIVKLLAILVICTAFMIRPKVIYLTLKRFLKKLLVKFTGGNSYRVVSTQPTKGIRIL